MCLNSHTYIIIALRKSDSINKDSRKQEMSRCFLFLSMLLCTVSSVSTFTSSSLHHTNVTMTTVATNYKTSFPSFEMNVTLSTMASDVTSASTDVTTSGILETSHFLATNSTEMGTTGYDHGATTTGLNNELNNTGARMISDSSLPTMVTATIIESTGTRMSEHESMTTAARMAGTTAAGMGEKETFAIRTLASISCRWDYPNESLTRETTLCDKQAPCSIGPLKVSTERTGEVALYFCKTEQWILMQLACRIDDSDGRPVSASRCTAGARCNLGPICTMYMGGEVKAYYCGDGKDEESNESQLKKGKRPTSGDGN